MQCNNILLLFQYGRAEVAIKKSRSILNYDDSDTENEPDPKKHIGNGTCGGGDGDSKLRANGVIPHVPSENNVIARDKLILLPDPALNKNGHTNGNNNKKEMGDSEKSPDEESEEVRFIILF